MYAYVVAHFNLSHTTASGSQVDEKSDNESDFVKGGEETLLGQGVGEQHGNGSFPSTTGLGKYLPVISHMLMCTCMNTLLSNLVAAVFSVTTLQVVMTPPLSLSYSFSHSLCPSLPFFLPS